MGDALAATAPETLLAHRDFVRGLARTIDEIDVRQHFVDSLQGALGPAQRKTLSDRPGGGLTGLVENTAQTMSRTDGVQSVDRGKLETELARRFLGLAGLSDVEPERYAWIVRAWIDAIPGSLEPKPAEAVTAAALGASNLQVAARAQLAAMEKLFALGELDETQLTNLRQSDVLLLPQLVESP